LRNADQIRNSFEPTSVPPQYFSSSYATEPSSTPPASRIPTAQIANSDPYLACKTCSKVFKNRGYLLEHLELLAHEPQLNSKILVAGGVKPSSTIDPYLDCKTCGKTYQTREYLEDHVEVLGHAPKIDTTY
jgi:hypothetical protein